MSELAIFKTRNGESGNGMGESGNGMGNRGKEERGMERGKAGIFKTRNEKSRNL